jgi:hypothetical protein
MKHYHKVNKNNIFAGKITYVLWEIKQTNLKKNKETNKPEEVRG